MKSNTDRINTIAVSAIAPAMLVIGMATPAQAQAGSRSMPPTSVERRNEVLTRQADEYEIEKSARDLKTAAGAAADQRRVNEIGAQIKHDFEGLQENYNRLVLFMNDKDAMTRQHDVVLRAVAEIRKCAGRLKTNLALPKSAPDKSAVVVYARPTDDALMELRKHIYDFVTNPLFESPGVLNVEKGKQAGRDLDRIIEISQSINKRTN